jgi:hypothetical protein
LRYCFLRAASFAERFREIVLIVLEEVGMAEHQIHVTQVNFLHPLRDEYFGRFASDPGVSFLALPNTFLDADKMNRGIVILR